MGCIMRTNFGGRAFSQGWERVDHGSVIQTYLYTNIASGEKLGRLTANNESYKCYATLRCDRARFRDSLYPACICPQSHGSLSANQVGSIYRKDC